MRLRPPRALQPRDRRVPLRARLVVAHVPPPVPVQPGGGALRSSHRLLPVRAGLVGPPLQLPLRLPRLAVRAGVGPLRLPARLVGPRVPAALRVRARPLQRRLRPVHMPARLPRRALRAALPRRPLRASVPRQVSRGNGGCGREGREEDVRRKRREREGKGMSRGRRENVAQKQTRMG